MYFGIEVSPGIIFVLMVLIRFNEAIGDKTLNLRIGFDLTQGKNGAPALRIRDFEGSSESNYKNADDEVKTERRHPKPSIRADSFSESKEEKDRDYSSREEAETSEQEDGGSDGGFDRHRSTKGIKPAEYEPEENVNVHNRFNEEDDESGNDGRRYKRGANHKLRKIKGKKVRSFGKHYVKTRGFKVEQ